MTRTSTSKVFNGEVPFKLPVSYDPDNFTIDSADGVVLFNCGSWVPYDDLPKIEKRAQFLKRLLNGELVITNSKGEYTAEEFRITSQKEKNK